MLLEAILWKKPKGLFGQPNKCKLQDNGYGQKYLLVYRPEIMQSILHCLYIFYLWMDDNVMRQLPGFENPYLRHTNSFSTFWHFKQSILNPFFSPLLSLSRKKKDKWTNRINKQIGYLAPLKIMISNNKRPLMSPANLSLFLFLRSGLWTSYRLPQVSNHIPTLFLKFFFTSHPVFTPTLYKRIRSYVPTTQFIIFFY